MSKSNSQPKPVENIDPTLPFTEIEIGGKIYKMCFNHEALAQAEAKLLAEGHDANLLFRAPPFTFGNIRILFAVSLMPYQPDTDFEAAKNLVNWENKGKVLSEVLKAWNINMPEPEAESKPGPTEAA